MHPANEIIAERDHAAASGLMHHANTDALVVLDYHHGQPVGIITAADIARAVADGEDLNQVRVHDLLATQHRACPCDRAVNHEQVRAGQWCRDCGAG